MNLNLRTVSGKAIAVAATAAGLVVAAGAASVSAAAVSSPAAILGAGSGAAVTGHYIVALQDGVGLRTRGIPAMANGLANAYGGKVDRVWDKALHGFSVSMSEEAAQQLAADPGVAWIQQEQRYHIADAQEAPGVNAGANWSLDRLDQRKLPLNNAFNYQAAASAVVHAYVIDTGININHVDFGGRASWGPNEVISETPAHGTSDDCQGHGTFVAGLIGGAKYGVAKKVNLVAVRAFDCSGNTTETPLVDSLNWIIGHAIKPAVINMSLGPQCIGPCPPGTGQAIITAEQNAVAAGIPVVTAAGNALVPGQPAQDACNNPVGSAGVTINVGAVNPDDSYASYSNFGGCVDIWAPGTDIQSDTCGAVRPCINGSTSNTAIDKDTGTSFAAPYVTGAIAVLQSSAQFATAAPAQIAAQLDANATQGQITGLPDSLSPNKLLYIPPTFEGSSVALAKTTPTGPLEAFGTNAVGNLFLTTQTAPGAGAWNNWTKSANTGFLSVGADTNADGRLQLIAISWTGEVWSRQQTTPGGIQFTTATKLSGVLQSVAVAHNQNGALELLGVNQQGTAFFSTQTSVGATTFSSFNPIATGPGPQFTFIAAETDSNNLIEAFAVDTHGNIWQTKQTAVNTNSWTAFAQLPAPAPGLLASEVAVARDGNNKLNLIALNSGGGIWQRSQTAPGANTWTGWTQVMNNRFITHVAVETNPNGTVAVMAVDSRSGIWYNAQTAPGSTTYGTVWTTISGLLRP